MIQIDEKFRKVYYQVEKALKSDYSIIIILGLRKTGKTKILQQLAEHHSGFYVDFRDYSRNSNEYYDILDRNEKLLLFDEIGYLQDFDIYLGRLPEDLAKKHKKVVLTSSSYGTLKQLAHEKLGGGRAYKIELFPLDFEEYLYFSNKIQNYKDNYLPTLDDVWGFFRLDGIPIDMRFIVDEQYMLDTFSDTYTAHVNQDGSKRDIVLTEPQYRSIIDLLAYTLNEHISVERLQGKKQIGVRELGSNVRGLKISSSLIGFANRAANKMGVDEIAKIVAFLYRNGFLFADLVQQNRSRQNPDDIVQILLSVLTVEDLKAVLNKYTLSVISPLLYTRLMINLEIMANIVCGNNDLLGLMFELAMKSEIIYKDGYMMYHYTYKYSYALREVDINYRNLLIECSLRHKKGDERSVDKVFKNIELIRVLTDKPGVFEKRDNYYLIGFPQALLMLSNNSIFDLSATKCY